MRRARSWLAAAGANHSYNHLLIGQVLKLIVVAFGMESFDDGPFTHRRGHLARRGKVILGCGGRTG